MNLNISGHHLELSYPVKDYIKKKLERLKKHFDDIIEISIILKIDPATKKDKNKIAEINIHLCGKNLHFESEANNMYAAIDQLFNKLRQQILRHKRKIHNQYYNQKFENEKLF
tara:strand:- start:256 stop:594 length:339 start_codon:yes stop_codon:yes gene_type:complete